MFIRVELGGYVHEWGWDSSIVPVVGDTLWLCLERPDEEPTGDHYLDCVVTKRMLPVSSDDASSEAWLIVTTEDEVPEGYIADSPAWPSQEHGKRKEQLCRDLEYIRSKT